MSLSPGSRIGPYEIIAPLGAGGMGVVFRARDLQLQRDVAVKVLPPAVAGDPDRLLRFTREARVLAALNHPNIAAIYGVHEADGIPALAMELVEGVTLAQRIADGPIRLREVLSIGKQIAEALEAAHEQGIIHRDLKPANIKIRPDGEVKVLDFGIAKIIDTAAAGERTTASETHIASMTSAGAILGTAPYMSPEQARGAPVDRRTDIWALGVVLWEMLVGRKLFGRTTFSDTIACILQEEPDWSALPGNTPESLQRLLRRALHKERKMRLDSATVARLEFDDAAVTSQQRSRPNPVVRWLPWALAAVAISINAWLLLDNRAAQTADTPAVLRVSAEVGAELALQEDLGSAVIVSPDGKTLVFATDTTTAPSTLYIRRLDQLTTTELRETDQATSPFFSHDGQWVGFFADGKLKRVHVNGGPPESLVDARAGRGGSWAADGSIVFAAGPGQSSVLYRLDAGATVPRVVSSRAEGEFAHRWPQVLPGNRGVLYSASSTAAPENWDEARVMVQPTTGVARVVQQGYYGRYVASGHLLYVKGGTLYAAPFDLTRLEITGATVSLFDNVVSDPSTGAAHYAVADNGTIVYVPGSRLSPAAQAVWMDRGGTTEPLITARTDWSNPQVSPDGKQIAFDISDGKQTDIWLQNLTTGQSSRLTFDPSDDEKPVWTPDSKRITFTSTRRGAANLYWQNADGTGTAERLAESPYAQSAASWHPNGRLLAYHEVHPATRGEVLILAVNGSPSGWRIGRPQALVSGPANETEPTFSPDGRWLAYQSNETGRAEVFVRTFEGGSGKWQISNGGGRDATWSRTRSELLWFGLSENRIMVAPFAVVGDSFRAGIPGAWSTTVVGRPTRAARTFDVHPDGERVVVVPARKERTDHVTLVLNFFDELRRIARATR
jgi:serine/threonine protein kinase/Tol biopolymer transport system component